MMRRDVLSRGLAAAVASSGSSSSASSSIASASRSLHSSSSSHAESSASASSSSSESSSSGGRGRRPLGGRGRSSARTQLPPYAEWKHGDGKHLYQKPPPGIGPHWIADTPFPLNPSFNPPPPLPQALRDEMWSLHSSEPASWGPRELSSKYGIAMNRIEAVLRLKALEGEWAMQGKPLQSAFVRSMEKLLGSTRLAPAPNSSSTASKPVRDDSLADEATAASASSSTSTSGSGDIRGPVREEMSDQEASSQSSSVIAKALKASTAESAKRLTVLPTGGPAVPKTKADADKVSRRSKEIRQKARPTLRITEVPNKSYAGAGVVARNQHRAERRARASKAAEDKKKKGQPGERRAEAVKKGKLIAV